MERAFLAGDALDDQARGFVYENAQRLLLLGCLMNEGRSIAIETSSDKEALLTEEWNLNLVTARRIGELNLFRAKALAITAEISVGHMDQTTLAKPNSWCYQSLSAKGAKCKSLGQRPR